MQDFPLIISICNYKPLAISIVKRQGGATNEMDAILEYVWKVNTYKCRAISCKLKVVCVGMSRNVTVSTRVLNRHKPGLISKHYTCWFIYSILFHIILRGIQPPPPHTPSTSRQMKLERESRRLEE